MLKTIEQLDKSKLVLVIVSVALGVASQWLLSQYGALTTPDSANYISTAAHIASGRGVTQYDGSPLWLWSPFYPVVLAAAEFVSGADPRAVVPPVNSILFGLTVFLAGLL